MGYFKPLLVWNWLTSGLALLLDGVTHGLQPQWDYAQWLYELFTLGEGNGYTEEVSLNGQGYSGYVEREKLAVSKLVFDSTKFNSEDKQFWKKLEYWVMMMLLTFFCWREVPNRAISYVKNYMHFLYPRITDLKQICPSIMTVTNTFVAVGFEIALC